ncbi:MAG: hypothetical protein AAF340_01825 [Pseudomonadota bacterium]
MLDFYLAPLGLDAFAALGVLSGLLSLLCFVPYAVDTVAGRTQPERASWLIWSVLGTIAFFSQAYEGAGASLWFVGVQVGGTIFICLLSITRGAGAYMCRKNLIVFGIAGLGLIAWYFTETAVYALAISISISLLGGAVTVEKAFRDPESETLVTWGMAWVASVLAGLSVGVWDPILLAYPAYLLALYTAIVGAVLLGRRRRSLPVPEPRIVFDVSQDQAVFIHSPGRPLVAPELLLAPEGDIFDEVDQLATEKYVQVPVVDEKIH